MSARTVEQPVTTRGPDLRLVKDRAANQQLPLALHWEVSPGVPAIPDVPPDLRVIGGLDVDFGEFADLPDPRLWVARLARAVSEVMAGERPVAQLTRWLSRDQLVRVGARASAIARHPSARAQRGVSRSRTVRAVRVCPVGPRTIEASAVLVGGPRAQAIAIRLEVIGDRWLATIVDLR